MRNKLNRMIATAMVFLFTVSVMPVSLFAADGAVVTDSTSDGDDSHASITGGVTPVNPNDPSHYPAGYYPAGSQYGLGGGRSMVPTLIGGAVGGLLGSHFGLVGAIAGAALGGFLGNVVGGQLAEQPFGNYHDNYNNRLDNYYASYYDGIGSGQSRLGMLPGIAGGVFGALIGSQFGGALGFVVGGIGGFLAGQVLARVLFPQQYYDRTYYGGNYPYDNFRNLPAPFQGPGYGTPGYGTPGYGYGTPGYGYPGYGYPGFGTPYPGTGVPASGLIRDPRYSGGITTPGATYGYTGDLATLRQGFLKAASDYQDVLKDGTEAQKLESRGQFQAAHDAYYRAKAAAESK